MSNTQRPIERTPRGIAKWITVNKPDTKYKEEGEYRLVLLLDPVAAAPLQAKIDEAIRVAIVEAKANKANVKYVKTIKASQHVTYGMDTDKDGNETGLVKFKFTAKASGKRKDGTRWTFKPIVFDNMQQVIDTEKVNIWGGSEVKVAFELSTYGVNHYSPTMGVGVSLKLSAVQILKLKTGNGKDAAAFGFEAEESDFAAGETNQGGSTPDRTNEEF